MHRLAALSWFALGALVRRAGRALASGLALALVTAAVSSALFLTDALRAEALHELAAAPDLTVTRLHGGRPATLAASDTSTVAAIPGVTAAHPRVWGYIYLDGAAANLTVVGTDALADAMDLRTIVRGRPFSPGVRGWVVLGQGLAALLGATPGDGVELAAPGVAPVALRVTAVFVSTVAVRTADVALCDVRDARAVLGLADGEATDLAVHLAAPEEAPVVARKITEALPGTVVTDRAALGRAYALTYGRRGGLLVVALLPALLALLVLAWDRASGLGAAERREVAALRCAGWTARDVLTARMLESTAVAVTATLVGTLAAYEYVFALGAPGLRDALLGWSTLYPRLELTPVVTAGQLVSLVALVAGPYVAASVIPAWQAATLDPADALRA